MRSPTTLRSLAVRLSALGLLGVLLALAVLVSALAGFDKVQEADQAAELISQAQRYHQDADQAHDALHADVLEVLQANGAASRPALRATALAVLQADVAEYRVNVDRAGRLPLPAALSSALATLRPAQLAYADHALSLGELPTSAGAAQADLVDFQAEFGRLQKAQGQVTEQLARTQQAGQSRAEATQRRAARDVLIAGALALAGLLALSGSLAHMGGRIGALLRRERDVAETLQRSLLPERLPALAGARLAARFLPSEIGAQVGGDWYDAFALPDGALALVIGDVTGHDIRAASAMGQLRNAVRAWSVIDLAPAVVFDRLNDLLFNFDAKHMATCVYLRLPAQQSSTPDPTELVTITVANAGHCPPLVLTPSGHARLLEAPPCPPLGAVPDMRYSQHDHQIEYGSIVLLYTDGLIERRDRDLETGFDLLQRAAADASTDATDPDELCDGVLDRLSTDGPAADDVALLAVKVGLALALQQMAATPPGAFRPPAPRRPSHR